MAGWARWSLSCSHSSSSCPDRRFVSGAGRLRNCVAATAGGLAMRRTDRAGPPIFPTPSRRPFALARSSALPAPPLQHAAARDLRRGDRLPARRPRRPLWRAAPREAMKPAGAGVLSDVSGFAPARRPRRTGKVSLRGYFSRILFCRRDKGRSGNLCHGGVPAFDAAAPSTRQPPRCNRRISSHTLSRER